MLKSETVVINQHIGGILRELKTSEPSWNPVIPVSCNPDTSCLKLDFLSSKPLYCEYRDVGIETEIFSFWKAARARYRLVVAAGFAPRPIFCIEHPATTNED